MTNPRSRNFLTQASHMAVKAQLPALESPHSADPEELRKLLGQVIEVLNTRHGRGGNPFEAWATMRELGELGLTGGSAGNMPSDQAGIMLWTARKRFVLVTLESMSKTLANPAAVTSPTTTDGGGVASSGEIERLQSQITALKGAISDTMTKTEVQRALSELSNTLRTAWKQDIANAVRDLRTAFDHEIEGLRSALTQVQMIQQQQRGVMIEFDTPATVWTMAHNLGRRVLVTVLDDTGTVVFPDVVQTDLDTVEVTHGTAIAGFVVVR